MKKEIGEIITKTENVMLEDEDVRFQRFLDAKELEQAKAEDDKIERIMGRFDVLMGKHTVSAAKDQAVTNSQMLESALERHSAATREALTEHVRITRENLDALASNTGDALKAIVAEQDSFEVQLLAISAPTTTAVPLDIEDQIQRAMGPCILRLAEFERATTGAGSTRPPSSNTSSIGEVSHQQARYASTDASGADP